MRLGSRHRACGTSRRVAGRTSLLEARFNPAPPGAGYRAGRSRKP